MLEVLVFFNQIFFL